MFSVFQIKLAQLGYFFIGNKFLAKHLITEKTN